MAEGAYMKNLRLIASITSVVVASCFVSDAQAQAGGIANSLLRMLTGGGRGGHGGDGQNGNSRQPSAPGPNSSEQVDGKLAQLQQDLRLMPEQGDAWQAFATKTRAYADASSRERERGTTNSPMEISQANGLQYIEQAISAEQTRLNALQDVETAAKALYQTLSPEQKSLADGRIPNIVAPRPQGGNRNGSGGSYGGQDSASGYRQSR
jgi:hypothetical protein